MAPHKFNGASRTPCRCYGEHMEHPQDETTYGYLREQRLEYQRHIYIYPSKSKRKLFEVLGLLGYMYIYI